MCGFDTLRDVVVEYGHKIQKAGVDVRWHYHPDLTHGFLQMAPWCEAAMGAAVEDVAGELKRMAYADTDRCSHTPMTEALELGYPV
jgi:acetyl esterase/lipase